MSLTLPSLPHAAAPTRPRSTAPPSSHATCSRSSARSTPRRARRSTRTAAAAGAVVEGSSRRAGPTCSSSARRCGSAPARRPSRWARWASTSSSTISTSRARTTTRSVDALAPFARPGPLSLMTEPRTQPNQYAGAGLTAPLPPSEAPPAAPATGDEPVGAQAASGLSPEAYTAWWQSLDQASKDYYTQCARPSSPAFVLYPARVDTHARTSLAGTTLPTPSTPPTPRPPRPPPPRPPRRANPPRPHLPPTRLPLLRLLPQHRHHRRRATHRRRRRRAGRGGTAPCRRRRACERTDRERGQGRRSARGLYMYCFLSCC